MRRALTFRSLSLIECGKRPQTAAVGHTPAKRTFHFETNCFFSGREALLSTGRCGGPRPLEALLFGGGSSRVENAARILPHLHGPPHSILERIHLEIMRSHFIIASRLAVGSLRVQRWHSVDLRLIGDLATSPDLYRVVD